MFNVECLMLNGISSQRLFPHPSSLKKMRITEIFHSIQGESSHAGRPCVFVRLTGCNLRCVWCDTAYAFYEGNRMTVAEVAERVRGYRCGLVEITGGEPLLQPSVHPLMAVLLDSDAT